MTIRSPFVEDSIFRDLVMDSRMAAAFPSYPAEAAPAPVAASAAMASRPSTDPHHFVDSSHNSNINYSNYSNENENETLLHHYHSRSASSRCAEINNPVVVQSPDGSICIAVAATDPVIDDAGRASSNETYLGSMNSNIRRGRDSAETSDDDSDEDYGVSGGSSNPFDPAHGLFTDNDYHVLLNQQKLKSKRRSVVLLLIFDMIFVFNVCLYTGTDDEMSDAICEPKYRFARLLSIFTDILGLFSLHGANCMYPLLLIGLLMTTVQYAQAMVPFQIVIRIMTVFLFIDYMKLQRGLEQMYSRSEFRNRSSFVIQNASRFFADRLFSQHASPPPPMLQATLELNSELGTAYPRV